MSSIISNFKRKRGISLETLEQERAPSHDDGGTSGFSQVALGFSSYDGELREPLVLPQGSPISIRVVRGSWGLLSHDCRANRPHLGFCPETPCSSPVATGISGLHSKFTQGVRPHLEWKQRTLLSSRVATVLSWSPLSGLKGVTSCGVLRWDSGLLSNSCRKRRASSRDDGGISWVFLSCGKMSGVSLELRQRTQGASDVGPGKTSLHSSCQGELWIALKSLQGKQSSYRLVSRNSVFLSSGNRVFGVAFKFYLVNQASSQVEAKNSALLSRCDGYHFEPIKWPKGVKPTMEF